MNGIASSLFYFALMLLALHLACSDGPTDRSQSDGNQAPPEPEPSANTEASLLPARPTAFPNTATTWSSAQVNDNLFKCYGQRATKNIRSICNCLFDAVARQFNEQEFQVYNTQGLAEEWLRVTEIKRYCIDYAQAGGFYNAPKGVFKG